MLSTGTRISWRLPMRLAAALAFLAAALATGLPIAVAAREARRADQTALTAPTREELGRLFDAVVETINRSFWDSERLTAIGWQQRAAQVRQSIVEAPSLEAAARGINALLGEIKTSHTALLTPDDVEYYILLEVFRGSQGVKELIAKRFWGAGVAYAGIGMFSVRIDGRDFVDAVLEGSPAEHAGLRVGDEIVSVDGAPYHPIRSFRGRSGDDVVIMRRRSADAVPEGVNVEVTSIAPLRAFREATLTSVRVIEREGRRIGYVHVWASVGDKSADALSEALTGLGVNSVPHHGEGKGERSPPALDGLIIDMRGKIGGTGSNAGRYLDILDPRGPTIRARNRGKERAKASVRGRTAVLIDHHTRSTAELFVHAYKRERQGPLIGTRTAGAVSAAGTFAMPGGNLLYLAVTGLEVDGETLEGQGVAPDVEVGRPIPYANGADPVLDAAIDLLARRVPARAGSGQGPHGNSQ